MESPLVNAAGSINGVNKEEILRLVEDLAETPIGAITVGSFTVPEQEGNEAKYGSPVYFSDQESGYTYNSMGLPNIGIEAAVKLMPEITTRAHEQGKPVIASVSPTKPNPEIGGPIRQTAKLVSELLETDVDFIEVNTACPNIVTEEGGRKPILGYDLEAMHELVAEVAKWAGKPPADSRLGIKLPPYLSPEERAVTPALAKLFVEDPVFKFIATSNTIPNQTPTDKDGDLILSVPGGAGGMSGLATKEIGRDQLQLWRELAGDDIEIVSMLGVDSGKELAVRRRLGAVAAGGVTMWWESDNWKRTATQAVEDYIEATESY